MVPIEHQLRPLLSGLATTLFHRLSSTAFYYVTLSMPPRSFGSALAPGSQMAPSGHTAAQCRHARARACVLLWVPAHASSARVGREGCRGVNGTMRHRKASPWRLYLAAAMTCALPAAIESASYIRLRTSVLPWLQPGRWGAAPHWVSAAFYHLSTILRVRGRISNPLVLHPTPPLIASERACLKPLHPDCMGCMSSR